VKTFEPDDHLKKANTDVLLVTVTAVEARELLGVAKKKIGDYETVYEGDQVYYNLGRLGDAQIYMVRSEMGSGGPGGSTMTISEAIDRLSPSAVIMVGIAFGVNREKQQIGDILISTHLWAYELQRVGTGADGSLSIIPRGNRVPASHILLSRFRSAELWWTQAKLRFGLLSSGEKLIDNIDFRDQLLAKEPEVVGGEMEGVGLYSAASRKGIDWIIVKAICDWADGKKREKKDQYQQEAAHNAAELTLSVIARGGFSPKAISVLSRESKDVGESPNQNSHPYREEWVVLVQDKLAPADMNSVLKALEPDIPCGEPVFLYPEAPSWQQAVEYQRKFVKELLIESRQSRCARFAVFSVAPIPLILHLGFMLADIRTRCFKLHIDTNSWVWPTIEPHLVDYAIHLRGLPEKTFEEECEVTIRVSLSARITADETEEVASDLPVQIDMFVDEPSRKWLRSHRQLDTIADTFREILEALQIRVPRCRKIHLFYAGPAPGAFVIGQLLNPRMIPPIQLYEYDRNSKPRYEKAIILPL
jgi:nucleoside phosphorylase